MIEESTPKIVDGYCKRSDKPREEAEKEAENLIQILIDASSYMFSKNHATGYSLLTYYCGYFRHYYPLEFITSFLNNAANDDDIKNGTELAHRLGIRITMPKWGVSRGEYYYDKDKKIISKGLSSIKYMGEKIAEQLYSLAHSKDYTYFVELLKDIGSETELDSRQLEILIKLDFFSDFGNQRELLYILDMFNNTFKKGEAKQIKKSKVYDTKLQPIIEKYSIGKTKAGAESANYVLTDINQIMIEAEESIKEEKIQDLSIYEKVRNFENVMGYPGYVSGNVEDRNRLYINEVRPLTRKKDGKQFGYSFYTTSIGSGISSRFTVLNRMYNIFPVKSGDIICCVNWHRQGEYFNMDYYTKVKG